MKIYEHDPAVVLVIDSDAVMLTAVAAALNMSGYQCHCARDGRAALRAAEQISVDLIVCDIDVDNKTGLQLCRRLRGMGGCAETPIVFVSADPAFDIVGRIHDEGGAYYLRKPYDPEVLLELADKALWMPHLVNMRFEAAETIPASHLSLTTPSLRASAATPSMHDGA